MQTEIPKCIWPRKRHTWKRSDTGCAENPGVFDNGNGGLEYHHVCPHCGTTRITVHSYCGRPENDGVWYDPAPPEDGRW